MATKNASIKLSELAMGSFVIEPVVTKKNWKNSYGRNDLAAHESADWAAAKGCMPIPLTQ
jgi:hypothetical protein